MSNKDKNILKQLDIWQSVGQNKSAHLNVIIFIKI